jgi:hypothetical protein
MISPLFGQLAPIKLAIIVAVLQRALQISSQGLNTNNPLTIATQGLL